MLQWATVGACTGLACAVLARSAFDSAVSAVALCLAVVVAVKGF